MAAALHYLHGEAISVGQQLGESLVQVIGEQTSRTFQTVDQRLELAAVQLQTLEAERQLNEDSARTVLADHLKQLPFVRAIWVLDREGRIVFDSDKGNIGVNLADREYFQVYRQQPATEFHLSAPVRSRSTGTWLISASRPLRGAGGNVVGVIASAVQPPHFERLWSDVHVRSGGAVTLFRRDGTLMLRSPAIDSAMGKRFPALPLFAEQLPKNPKGSYQTTAAIDPTVRFVSFRTLSRYPDLVVAIGRTYESVLGHWRQFALLSALFWLAAAAAAILLSVLRRRHLSQYRRSEARFGELAQAMPQIVFIADANGAMTFVSEQWTKATGQSVEAALAGRWIEQIHPEDRLRTIEDMRTTRTTGVSTLNEHRVLCKDGSYRWHLARSAPGRDHLGRIVRWYGTSTNIDRLKQAEATVTAQVNLLRMAGHLARLGGWAFDLPAQHFTWTDEASAMLDLPHGSAPTLESAIGLCAPEWRDLATQVAQDCLNQGAPFDVVIEMITSAGGRIWVRAIGQAVRDASGDITGMHGAIQDVTERRQAAVALIESEQRHAALFDTAPVPMWVMDNESHLHVAVNDAALACYGYTRDEFLALTALDLRPVQEQQRLRDLMAEGLAMNTPELWMHRRKDGAEFPVELVRRPIRYGERDAVFAVALDITARVRAEREVKAYLLTLQHAADAAQAITQHQSIEATMQEAVQQARTILGAHQAVIGFSPNPGAAPQFKALSLSETYARAQELMDDVDGRRLRTVVCDTNRPMRMTQAALVAHPSWRAFGREAGAYPVNGWLTVPITAGDGANVGYLQLSDKCEGEFTQQDEYVATELAQLVSIALQNVTLLAEVRKLNTELEETVTQRTTELRLSIDEMKTFSYSVSHDLRSPLASVDGFSRALAAELGGQASAKALHYLARIQDNVEKMDQLIEGLLSLAQLSQMELKRERVDLSVLAGDLLQRFRAEGREGAYDVEAGLVVYADGRLMLSVMENLLGNAWKFSSRRIRPEISVGWSTERGAYFVRDNGSGFDMAYADKLFAPFQRIHSQAEFTGSGVGLSTVSRVIARHGGRIWGESELDKGATFYFTLDDSGPGK